MKKKTATLTSSEVNFLIDLTFHKFPASLITEFAEKIVMPYYNGNFNAAVQDLIQRILQEQNFVHSHITHIRSAGACG